MEESIERSEGFCPKCFAFSLTSGLLSGLLLSGASANLLFLLPLQFVASRSLRLGRGGKPLLLAAALALVTALMLTLIRGPVPDTGFAYFSSAGLLAGLFALNANLYTQNRIASWVRVLAAAILAGLGMYLTLSGMQRSGIWAELETLISSSPELTELLLSMIPGFSLSELIILMQEIMMRSLVFSSAYLVLLAFAIGRAMAYGLRRILEPLRGFTLPDEFIWLFIASLAGMMIAETAGLLTAAYISWNILLTVALMYGMRGLGLLMRLGDSRPLVKALLPGTIIAAIIVPVFNMIFSLALGLLGILSIWITFSNGTGVAGSAESNDQNGPSGDAE